MLAEFKTFMLRGNVVDLAVGVMVGGAFGAIVKSLVDDILMPPLGLLMGNADFSNLFWVLKDGAKAAGPYASVEAAKAAGAVAIRYGVFLNTLLSFLIIGTALFAVVKLITKLNKPAVAPAVTKDCPRCATAIPVAASRCPHCTSEL